ncbi:MAG: NADP-specific glutamate dehydrogenase [Verrucomicrobiota bacterium]
MPYSTESFLEALRKRDPHQPEFHQAVAEVMHSIAPFLEKNPRYLNDGLLDRLVEPDRIMQFRVAWVDDHGEVHVNRGYRVQMSGAIGPYKGGLRFHPSVNLSVLKFLAFEQTFKNALTTLPLGAGKGGADFDPKGKSDGEVMRFCQAFINELFRHIGPETDVPAGDIGVGSREIGYLFGHYRRLTNRYHGAFTGKGLSFGGSLLRPQATGYGCVYFCEEMLRTRDDSLDGKRVLISGSGNVALHAAAKCIELGAKVVSLSDSDGTLHFPKGLNLDQYDEIMQLKEQRRGRLSELDGQHGCKHHAGQNPWHLKADIALPCATQNELQADDAKTLVKNGCTCVSEGANMPSTNEAIQVFHAAGALFAPGKAANAGGVATSGLEMAQNAAHTAWDRATIDNKLHEIMRGIHQACARHGRQENGSVNYVHGANIAGFQKIAEAMLAQGVG